MNKDLAERIAELTPDELARLEKNAESLDNETMSNTEADASELTAKITVEADDAVADLREVRDAADETREAIDALEASLRSLSKTTGNPEKDMEEMREQFGSWSESLFGGG